MKIIRGNYPPIPYRYSHDLRTLVSMMFRREPRERPSISSILRKPFISKRANADQAAEIARPSSAISQASSVSSYASNRPKPKVVPKPRNKREQKLHDIYAKPPERRPQPYSHEYQQARARNLQDRGQAARADFISKYEKKEEVRYLEQAAEIRKQNFKERQINQNLNNPQVSHLPLPGGSVYAPQAPAQKPNYVEIERRVAEESEVARENFEQQAFKAGQIAKRANILKRVNCNLKNAVPAMPLPGPRPANPYQAKEETPVGPSRNQTPAQTPREPVPKWKGRPAGTLGLLAHENTIQPDSTVPAESQPDNSQPESKWQRKADFTAAAHIDKTVVVGPALGIDAKDSPASSVNVSKKSVDEEAEDKFVEATFSPKMHGRPKWAGAKDSLVRRLDDRTLQQVVLEEQPVSDDTRNRTRVVRTRSGGSSPVAVPSPTKQLSRKPSLKDVSFGTPEKVAPHTPTKLPSDGLEIITLLPTPTKTRSSPTHGTPTKPPTPIKSPLVVNSSSDNDQDTRPTKPLSMLNCPTPPSKPASKSLTKQVTQYSTLSDTRNSQTPNEAPKTDTGDKIEAVFGDAQESIEIEDSRTIEPPTEEISLGTGVKKNLIGALGDHEFGKTASVDTSDDSDSDVDGEAEYESDFSGDSTSTFADSYIPGGDVAKTPEMETTVSTVNDTYFPSPAKAHDAVSIFEALECMRADLEDVLGVEIFCEVYNILEESDEPPLGYIQSILGKENYEAHYPTIFKLCLSDGVYTE